MVAAILIVGVTSGTFAALSALFLLNAPLLVAIAFYLVFGITGTVVMILALAAREMRNHPETSDPMQALTAPQR